MKRRFGRRGRTLAPESEEAITPMLEIFGGAFAVLLILFVIINLFNVSNSISGIEEEIEDGDYRISWGTNGEGFVVMSYPGRLWLIETGESVSQSNICNPGSPFVRYAYRKYTRRNTQLIFAIVENGVATMKAARDCLMRAFPNRPISIGWMVMNNEVLKAVKIDSIPAYITRVLEN